MMRFGIIVLLLVQAATLHSEDHYWIKFRDKANSPFQIQHPEQFLSQKSLDRRAKQSISIVENDLPISQAYIDSIKPFIEELTHRLKWFNMVIVRSEEENMNAIREFPFVESAEMIFSSPSRAEYRRDKFEEVTPVNQQNVDSNLYGLAYNQIKMLNADLLHQLGYRGAGMTIAMMDNGFVEVDSLAGFDSVRSRIFHTWNFVHNQQNVYVDGGHGTNTFSCIGGNLPGRLLGTAPDAGFFLYQTEDIRAEWVMEEYHWAAAAEMADSAGADILSTSLGYTTFNYDSASHTYADMTGDKTIITRASNIAFSKGMLVCNSAGNSGDDAWHYISAPADGNEVFTIGAVDPNEVITSFSSRGPNASGRIKPDVCAQGANCAVLHTEGGIALAGGTSFSCPILAGCAASLWGAFPEKSAAEIRAAIIESADRYSASNNDYGYGIPNFYNAYLKMLYLNNPNILRLQSEAIIYPNPFTDELKLALYNDTAGLREVQIFDLQGRKVYEFNIYLRKGTYEIVSLDGIKALQAGQYILRLEGKKKYSQRILKLN